LRWYSAGREVWRFRVAEPLVAQTSNSLKVIPRAYDRGVSKDFRFGVGLRVAKSLSSVQDEARRAEDLGFDVLHLPDHIGAPAPFPTLMAAATATKTLRVAPSS
jgi:hypothetical protein